MQPRILPLSVLLFVASLWLLEAKDPPPSPPPPMPQGENVMVYRGKSVDIPLKALGRATGQLRFLIRSQPKSGTLGDIRIINRKEAVVTYTHRDSAGEGLDSFTFAVQGPDTAVSAPGTISIMISEEPSIFKASPGLDFAEVLLGESRTQSLTISNEGGGFIMGKIEVPPPWKVIGSAQYQLERGAEKEVRLSFTPTEEREYQGRVSFSHDNKAVSALFGSGKSPALIEPRNQIEMRAAGGQIVRQGEVSLMNTTEAERHFQITYPPQIIGPTDFTLAAGEKKSLTIETVGGFLGTLEGVIEFKSGSFETSVPVKVYAVRPVLEIYPTNLDFGEIPSGQSAKRTFHIQNKGGMSARLKIAAPEQCLIVPDPVGVILTAGEKKEFSITVEPHHPGPWQEEVKIQASDTEPKTLTLYAVIGAKAVPSPIPSAPPSIEKMPSVAPNEPLQAIEEDPSMINNTPILQDVRIVSTTHNEIILDWKKPEKNVSGYLIEWREIIPGTPLKVKWNPWQGMTYQADGDKIIATLHNLPSGAIWFIRIRSVDLNTKSVPTEAIRIATFSKKTYPWLWWLGGLLAAAGVVTLIFRLRKDAAIKAAEDSARLNKLEGD